MSSPEPSRRLLSCPEPVHGTGGFRNRCAAWMHMALHRLLRMRRIDALYAGAPSGNGPLEFTRSILDGLQVSMRLSPEEYERIPTSGPVVVVANHPFGAVEGLLLANVLRSRRSDARIMANYLLRRVPELADLLIMVDPFGRRGSATRNLAPLRESLRWVRNGGLLGVFPAGEVSHYRLGQGVSDPDWSPLVARIVRKTGAPVLPVYFHGANSPLFQFLGLIHPRLRTLLLPHELLRRHGKTVDMHIGALIPPARIAEFDNDRDLILFLRLRTYNLEHAARRGRLVSAPAVRDSGCEPVHVAAGESPGGMAREIGNLPDERVLVRSGALQVLYATADEIPSVLREIGRLREIAFRLVGEGSGEEYDLDPFDDYYTHLVLWNSEACEVVGAYRLGLSDVIRPRFGKKGMYTCTLFKYKKAFLEAIEPSIELGRSFVRPEWQRNAQALPLLWKGLARFVAQRKIYRYLFGPVSISNRYQPVSQQYIVEFLKKNRLHDEFSRYVRPRTPPRFAPLFRSSSQASFLKLVKSIDDVNAMVADIEANGAGVPVLLKQYLRLGGELLGFNVDPAFGRCLDGLILVDLLRTDRRVLGRYMGRPELDAFHAHHAALGNEGN